MDNWGALPKCPAALGVMEAAVNRRGRDTDCCSLGKDLGHGYFPELMRIASDLLRAR